jgi:hypothetical protein
MKKLGFFNNTCVGKFCGINNYYNRNLEIFQWKWMADNELVGDMFNYWLWSVFCGFHPLIYMSISGGLLFSSVMFGVLSINMVTSLNNDKISTYVPLYIILVLITITYTAIKKLAMLYWSLWQHIDLFMS